MRASRSFLSLRCCSPILKHRHRKCRSSNRFSGGDKSFPPYELSSSSPLREGLSPSSPSGITFVTFQHTESISYGCQTATPQPHRQRRRLSTELCVITPASMIPPHTHPPHTAFQGACSSEHIPMAALILCIPRSPPLVHVVTAASKARTWNSMCSPYPPSPISAEGSTALLVEGGLDMPTTDLTATMSA